MTDIIEFLEARITEDEREANVCLAQYRRGDGGSTRRWNRMLAECAAKRAIIAQHQAWPVLAEKAPEYSTSDDGLNGISYRVNQQMMWLTEQEYVKKFGEAPPTAPMIRTLAAVYKDHPDYQPEWEA